MERRPRSRYPGAIKVNALNQPIAVKLNYLLCAVFSGVASSCLSHQISLTIVDDSVNPVGASNQLELARNRGEVAHVHYGASDAALRRSELSGSRFKKWIFQNWGAPDRSYEEKGIEYLIYEKRSKEAPNYSMQFMGGERPVTLGYRDGVLVRIEAYFQNCPAYMTGPFYTLPR